MAIPCKKLQRNLRFPTMVCISETGKGKKKNIKMGKRTQTLDRGRLEKSVMEECLTPSVKHGGGNVMVWGCFGAGKVGDLYKVKGILNKEGYHSILQRHAILCGQRLIGANFLLQQDNDPKHTSKLCKNYLYVLCIYS